jgi:hypothetical protein
MQTEAQRKQQLIAQGEDYRAQILKARSAVRKGAEFKSLAGHAKQAALGLLEEKLRLKTTSLKTGYQKILPIVLDGVRKPVLYAAMMLGAISVLPRFIKGRKSNDNEKK